MTLDTTALAGTGLHDAGGASVRLGEQWAHRPAAVVFLRHFGCTFCRQHVAELQEHYGEITEAGGGAVAVGLGTPAEAARFARERDISFPLLVSEDNRAHDRAGLERGRWRRVINPGMVVPALRALFGGHGVRLTRTDMSQLGGTFVIEPAGTVAYEHRARSSDDNAPIGDVVSAIRRATA